MSRVFPRNVLEADGIFPLPQIVARLGNLVLDCFDRCFTTVWLIYYSQASPEGCWFEGRRWYSFSYVFIDFPWLDIEGILLLRI